jgi:predicted  nucleic acid-binding Zn-ribbon protein
VSERNAVLGNFQINLPAPNGASVSISGYVYESESLESLNERMDTCREALIRQQAILEVPVLQKEVEALERMLEDHRKSYDDLLERSKAKHKLTSQDDASMRNLPVQIKQIETKLKEGQSKISSVKKAA